MYSIVLMMSMTSPADAPQGILFNRGCDGGNVRASVRATVSNAGARVRAVVSNRPQPLRNLAGAVVDRQPVRGFFGRVFAPRGGCGGTYASAGGVSASVNVQAGALPMPAGPPAVGAVPPAMEGPVRRAIVRNQLRKALVQNGSPTALKALADPDVFEALTAKVHREMSRAAMAAGPNAPVGRLGDGTILKLIIDNLPAILDAAERIWKLFSVRYWTPADAYANTLNRNGQELFDREWMLAA